MKNYILTSILTLGVLLSNTYASSVKRERPAEWEGLAPGGRFMDRFLPMAVQGELTSDVWGADNVIPRYVDNGLEDSTWSYWGGNAVLSDDDKYHLYVCRWREDSEKGHMEWPRSFVVHAIADNSFGPYTVKETLGHGHNPELFKLVDGRFVVYVSGGYYIADQLEGPWEYGKFEFDKRDRRIIEGLSNLTFAQREDGSYIMLCRGGGIWFSKTGITPYHQVTDARVYPPIEGRFEDPVIWRTHVQYHMIVNDWLGRIAYYLRSKDGIHWKVEPGEAYLPGLAKYQDGTVVDWYKYERIKVLQDKYGRATQAHFAVIDVVKKQDEGDDNHSSKHICIPLSVGRLLSILDKEKITAETKTICVKITAEDDFNPHTDIDIESLRFGASEEVNFGRGCKAVGTEKSGDDLIVTFDGAGNGITADNFTTKLLGKTSRGKLLFGYARLPWLNYLEPALSSCVPKFTQKEDGFDITVEVQNFGQVDSERAKLKVGSTINNKAIDIATTEIAPLKPFEKTTVKLSCGKIFDAGTSYNISVIINPDDADRVELLREITPVSVQKQSIEYPSVSKGSYQPERLSLAQHNEAPQWLQDAKIGIYFHWGVYSVPAYDDEWYPRHMHAKNGNVYKHHVKAWGDPMEFGYADFVPMFKAEHFDADEWALLFKKAGAKFAGPVAEHHDGFAMWDSEVTPWNAADMGPKRDITGELEKAIRKQDMRFITTFHHARNSLWEHQPGKWTGHYDFLKKDFPSLLENDKRAIMYGYMPREKFVKMWKDKLTEVIDQYHPDIIWFDSWLHEIHEKDRFEFAAYYLNQAQKRDQDVVIVRKQDDLPLEFSILDHEKSRTSGTSKHVWMTDDTISTGSWCYTENLKIKPAKDVIHAMADTVSKNGIVLLNLSPKADGMIPQDQRKVLLELGDWLNQYGQAIYSTRPWKTYGEGPTKEPEGGFRDHRKFSELKYSAADIRYTRSKDGKTLYAIVLGLPTSTTTLKAAQFGPNVKVDLLGIETDVDYVIHGDGTLTIQPPASVEGLSKSANVYKITGMDFSK